MISFLSPAGGEEGETKRLISSLIKMIAVVCVVGSFGCLPSVDDLLRTDLNAFTKTPAPASVRRLVKSSSRKMAHVSAIRMHRKSKRYDFVHTIGAIVGPKLAIVPLHAVRDAGVAAMTWGKSEHPDDWASTLCMFGEIVVRNTECDIAAIKPDCNGRFLEHFSLPRNEPIRDGERLVFINREDRAFPAEVLDASNQRNVKVVVEPEVVRGGGVFVRPNGKLVGIPLRYGIKCQRFWSWFISTETALECLE